MRKALFYFVWLLCSFTLKAQNQIKTYEYWFDYNYSKRISVLVSPTQIFSLNTSIPVGTLANGFHSFHLRFQDSEGKWSSVASQFFVKEPGKGSNTISEVRYFFDFNSSGIISQPITTTFNPYDLISNIDCNSLSSGQHTIHFQFKDLNGEWSSVTNDTFSLVDGTDVYGTVYDASIDFENRRLDYTPQSNVTVSLKQGSTVIATTKTDTKGFFDFPNATESGYTLEVIGNAPIGCTVTINDVSAGLNLDSIKLPETVLSQTTSIVDSLISQNFEESWFYGTINFNEGVNAYNQANCENFVYGNKSIVDNYNVITETMGRLWIAQKALKELSDDAGFITAEMSISAWYLGTSAVDFIASVLNNIEGKPEAFIIEKVLLLATEDMLYMCQDICGKILSLLPDGSFKNTSQTVIMGLFNGLEDQIDLAIKSGKGGADLINLFLQPLQNLVTNAFQIGVFQGYILNTQNVSDADAKMATELTYSGTFSQAYQQTISNTSQSSIVQNDSILLSDNLNQINNLRNSSNIVDMNSSFYQFFEKTLKLINVFGLSDLFKNLGFIASAINLYNLSTTFGVELNFLEQATYDAQLTTSDAFLKAQRLNGEKYSKTYLQAGSSNLQSAVLNYENSAKALISLANQNSFDSLGYWIQSFANSDSILGVAIRKFLYPIEAAAPNASNEITGFDSLFSYSIAKTLIESDHKRFSALMDLIAYRLDSSSVISKDSMINYLDASVSFHDSIVGIFTSIQNLISSVPAPPYIKVDQVNVPSILNTNSSNLLKIRFTNYGAQNADSLYAKLTLNNGFTTSQDSIYLGDLNTSVSDSISYNIFTPNDDTVCNYVVTFISPNKSINSYANSLESYTTTSINPLIPNDFNLNIFPNPTDKNFTLSFKSSFNGLITVQLQNVLGEVIKNVYSGQNSPEIVKNVNVKELPPGIYFLKISLNSQRIIKKLIVGR